MGLQRGERPAYKIQLEDYHKFPSPLPVDAVLKPENKEHLLPLARSDGHSVVFNKNLNLNQGAYFTRVPPQFAALIDEALENRYEDGLPVDTPKISNGGGSTGTAQLSELVDGLDAFSFDVPEYLYFDDGARIARQIEADIAEKVGDRVRVPVKRRGLHQTVDERAWQDLLGGFEPLATYDFEYGFDLAERPVAETLASGTVVGVQGRLLVLETVGSTYAVDLRDLVGYELDAGGADRQLQSSLGAFQ
jgi:hypothetical protein